MYLNKSEIPDPPEAPVWYNHAEANSYGDGWTAGYEAALKNIIGEKTQSEQIVMEL